MILFEPSEGMRAIVAARLAEPLPARAAHLAPVWRAVMDHDVAFATVMQNEGRFTVPDGRPAVLIVGDDMAEAKGVRAFSARSLRAFLPRCAAVGIITSGAELKAYAALVAVAVATRRSVAIIETLPHVESEWLTLAEKVAPDARLLFCRPFPWTVPG